MNEELKSFLDIWDRNSDMHMKFIPILSSNNNVQDVEYGKLLNTLESVCGYSQIKLLSEQRVICKWVINGKANMTDYSIVYYNFILYRLGLKLIPFTLKRRYNNKGDIDRG